MKKILTWLLVVSMILGMVPLTPADTEQGGATAKAAAVSADWLGQAEWINKDISYSFSPVGDLGEDARVFSISVDNNGYFTGTAQNVLERFVNTNSSCTISGLCLNDKGEIEYITKNDIVTGTKLVSLTVQASQSGSIAGVGNFVRNLVFFRNGETGDQNVTVASSQKALEDKMTAVALPDGLHYYRYVPWNGKESNMANRTWNNAYKLAKESTYNGMQGYLATITSDLEQIFICKQIMNTDSSSSQGDGAWVGGVRTNLSNPKDASKKIVFDADTMPELYPGERYTANLANTWYWMCGPEAGHSFYRLYNEWGHEGTSDGCDESYTKWYTGEPNNTFKSNNAYNQEYCMEYGYDEKGAWNDLWPEDGTNASELWKMTGYLIEYSPYTQVKDDGTTDVIDPDDSTVDVRTIPKDMTETNYYVDAKDFIVGLDEVKTLTDSIVNSKSEAKILDGDGKPVTGTIKPDVNELANLQNKKTPGDLPLTFTGTVGSENAVPDKVTVHVVDDGGSATNNNGTTTVQVGGNHFTISYEDLINVDGDDITNIGSTAVESLIRNHAGIIALKNGTSVNPSAVVITEMGKKQSGGSPDSSAKLTDVTEPSDRGTYLVELSYTADGATATATIEVTVIGYPRIKANDLIISVDTAKTITDTQLKDNAEADVYETASKDSVMADCHSTITSTPSPGKQSVNAMGEAGQKGQTKLTFSHEDVELKGVKVPVDPAEITVTIVDEAKIQKGTDGKNVQIGGNNFTISQNEYDTIKERDKETPGLFEEMLKLNSEVTALLDGGRVDFGVIRATAADKPKSSTDTEDKYDVTLSYDGVEVTVTMTVTKEAAKPTPTPDKPIISATDFLVTVDEAKNITSGTVIDKSGATVSNGGTPTVSGDSLTTLKNATKDGKVPVQFDDDKADSKIVTATVKDKVGQGKGMTTSGKVQIGANNFTIELSKAQDAHDGKSNDLLKELAKVIALENGGNVDVGKILVTNPQIIGVTPGTYEGLEFSYDGVTVKVNVTVGDAGTKDPNVTGGGDKPTVSPDPGEDRTFELTNPKNVPQPVDPSKKVQKVTLDGDEIPSTDYTVTDGNLTISKDKVGTLQVGDHPVVITYTDGSAKTFTIHVIDYDESTVIKHVPVLKLKKVLGVKQKFDLNLVGINKNAKKIYKSSKKKVAKINKKGVITAKKKGKCVVKAFVIQNGSYYKVKVNLTVKKSVKNYNLKKKAISKKVKGGKLPEFNVYKRVYKNKKATLKFNSVAKDAKIKYSSKNKKIATVKKKGKKCVILGKKQGFTIVTAKIRQHGKLYVTRIVVRVDDHKKNKQLKKWLK